VSKDKKQQSKLIIIIYLWNSNFLHSKIVLSVTLLQPSECGETRVNGKEERRTGKEWQGNGKRRRGKEMKVEEVYGKKK
jgi:hypothetical protein